MIAGFAIGQAPGQRRQDVVIAHSISSTVHLDFRQGVAHKTYSAPGWVRALYRVAFQAPFPYESNRDAMDAAAARRTIAGVRSLPP